MRCPRSWGGRCRTRATASSRCTRRILYGMNILRLDPGSPFKKRRQDRRRRDGLVPSPRAIRRSTTRWCASLRTSPRVIRWSTGRATSATSMAIRPPPTAHRSAHDGCRAPPAGGIDEDPSTSARIIPATRRSPSSFPPHFRTCWRTARQASRWHATFDPTPQRGRALRCGPLPDRKSEGEH